MAEEQPTIDPPGPPELQINLGSIFHSFFCPGGSRRAPQQCFPDLIPLPSSRQATSQAYPGIRSLASPGSFPARSRPYPVYILAISRLSYLRLATHFKFLIVGPDQNMVTKQPYHWSPGLILCGFCTIARARPVGTGLGAKVGRKPAKNQITITTFITYSKRR